MIDRLIVGAVLSFVGWNGLFPEPPTAPTPHMLRVQAKEKSISAVCQRTKGQKQSKTVKELCERWERQQNG
jgi:hypothetical protein